MKLALPVRNPHSLEKILLKRGFELDAVTITKLEQFGIGQIWVHCSSLNMLEKFFNDDIITAQCQIAMKVAQTFDILEEQVNVKIPYRSYRQSIRELIQHLVENPNAAMFLGDLAGVGRDALISHSANVTYLSLLMGLKLEGYLVRQRKRINPAIAKQVTDLGVGSMLHDVGVAKLPEGAYIRFLETGDELDPEWRLHPALGYEMVRGHIEPSAATIVMNHHQRFDGTGYAGQDTPAMEGERIHVFARIVGLADQFDRMLHPPNCPTRPTVAVLGELLGTDLCKKFDPHVARALLSVVPPYPPGSRVRLSDGRVGICVDHTPADPCRPSVQIIDNFDDIDLDNDEPAHIVELYEEDEDLFVTDCEGTDVSNLNFSQPSIMQEMKGLILKRKGRVGLL